MEATGQDLNNLTDSQWNELIERQKLLLAGEDLNQSRAIPKSEVQVPVSAQEEKKSREEVKERAVQQQKSGKAAVNLISAIKWDYIDSRTAKPTSK